MSVSKIDGIGTRKDGSGGDVANRSQGNAKFVRLFAKETLAKGDCVCFDIDSAIDSTDSTDYGYGNIVEKADRDTLYKARVNPIVSLPGQGTLLFGDKTLLSRPSSFDRINVRRLFITLEKAISTAAKAQLFEFNDEFTRAQFRNLVEPFLRDVKGRRGLTDFLVVCDNTNNTQAVVDGNKFVADIFVKPARSINFITLSFVATRSGVEFSEISGS